MKFIAWAVAALTLVAAGAYTMVSLARWEWTRALFFAIVFVAAEVMLATAALMSRVTRIERQVTALSRQVAAPPTPATSTALTALRATRAEYDRFAWMRTDPDDVATRTNVFITLMVAAARVYKGAHYLTDVTASFFWAALYLAAVQGFFDRFHGTANCQHPQHEVQTD